MSTEILPADTAASTDEQHQALRHNILLADYSHFGVLEVTGADNFEFLNQLVSGELSMIRQEQALHTLLLDDHGNIVTDLYVLCGEERYIVLSEWLNGEQLRAAMLQHGASLDVQIEMRGAQSAVLLFEGPYSWELMAELFGIDVIGLPFLEFMGVEGGVLLRAGKHGEFSFKVLTDRRKAADLWSKAIEAGRKYHMKIGTRQFQQRARLENPCWNPASVGEFSRCPIELQLQWMVRYDKDAFVGREALLGRSREGVARRSIGFVMTGSNDALSPGNEVLYQDEVIGTVMTTGYSSERGCQVGQALLASAYAYADIDQYQVRNRNGERVAIRTSATPFIKNFSFLVNPAEHSYVKPGRAKSLLEQRA